MLQFAHKKCPEGIKFTLKSRYQEYRRVLGGAGDTCEGCGDHEELIIGHSLTHFLNHTTQEGLILEWGCLRLLTGSRGRLAVCVLWSSRQQWLAPPE